MGDQGCPEEKERCPGPGKGDQQWMPGMGTGKALGLGMAVCTGGLLRGSWTWDRGHQECHRVVDRDTRTRGRGTRSIPGYGMSAQDGYWRSWVRAGCLGAL